MPNIMKIRRCFLELQLKMSGMFFETQCRGIVLPDAENRMIVSSFVWTQYRSVIDRQMDRQTDG